MISEMVETRDRIQNEFYEEFYTERRSRFQIQIDLLNEKDIELADLNVGVLREALECALKNERKE